MKNAQDGMREKKESLKLFFPTRPFHHSIRLGPLTFRDPLLLCGVLYILLWMDAGGFLRAGLWAAFLHEMGHLLGLRDDAPEAPPCRCDDDRLLPAGSERIPAQGAALRAGCRRAGDESTAGGSLGGTDGATGHSAGLGIPDGQPLMIHK